MKRLMFAVGLAVFLGCSAAVFWADLAPAAGYAGSEEVVARLLRQEQTEDALELQQKLAQWYNLNLISVRKDRNFREAYWDILDFTDHAFAVLSVPSMGLRMPIYHGTAAETGAGHIQTTAFPLGEEGEHSALTVPVPLEEGTYFYIHILRQVLAYQITETVHAGAGEADYVPIEGAALCTLVCREQDGVTLLRGQMDPAAPPEQAVRVEPSEESDGWLAAACVVLAMGILLVPWLMWCRDRG